MQRSVRNKNVKTSDLQIRRNKQRFRGKGKGRKNTFENSAVNIASIATRSMLRFLGNTEDKYIDVTYNSTLGTGILLSLLNGLTLGTDTGNRIGISIKVVMLEINFLAKISATATVDTSFHWWVVRDEQANGIAMSSATYLVDNTNVCTLTAPDYDKRFYTYVDEIGSLSVNGPSTVVMRKQIPLGFHVRYLKGSNAGTIADIGTNSLYLVAFGSDNVNLAAVNWYFRLYYVDN